MKKEIQRLIFLSVVILFSACSRTQFAPVDALSNAKTEIPVDPEAPVVVPDVPPVYTAKLSSGPCNADSSTNVLSCLKCDVPQVAPAPPQLSVKAQALADAMFLACQIPNKSDRNSFRPTKEMLIDKLNRGSQLLYPETKRTAQMTMVIEGLTNPNDNSLRKKMFGGLWYQPPYSDAFETYFGVTVQEAKSTFCWDGNIQTPGITGASGLYSKQWADCQSNGGGNCKELPEYVAALGYRDQLSDVLFKSIYQPYVAPVPEPTKKCTWDKFEGDDMIAAKLQLKKWKAEGRKLSMEIRKANGVGACGIVNENDLVVGAKVSIASYVCQ